jgi:hypothetical protein
MLVRKTTDQVGTHSIVVSSPELPWHGSAPLDHSSEFGSQYCCSPRRTRLDTVHEYLRPCVTLDTAAWMLK